MLSSRRGARNPLLTIRYYARHASLDNATGTITARGVFQHHHHLTPACVTLRNSDTKTVAFLCIALHCVTVGQLAPKPVFAMVSCHLRGKHWGNDQMP